MRRLRSSRWAAASAVAVATASVAIIGASSAATRNVNGARATTTPAPDRPLETAALDPYSLEGPEANIAYKHLRRAGATFVRIMMNWVEVAPDGPTRPAAFRPRDPGDARYRWGLIDNQVRDAVSNGFVPFIYVQAAPAWASRSCGSTGIGSCRPSPRSLADFMSAAARRYGGGFGDLPRVRYWQIWNEPNLIGGLRPQVDRSHRLLSPDFYRLMVNASADAIHAVHSDNQVIAGGLSAFGDDPPGDRISPLLFMGRLLCLTAKAQAVCHERVRFDIWAHHPYTSGDPTHHANLPNDVSLPDLWKMRRLLDAGLRAGTLKSRGPVRFWVTEFAWDTSPPDPKGVPEKLHARWVAEALYRMWAQGVSLVTWFLIRDQTLENDHPFQSGLYFRGRDGISSDTPKLALTAFRFPFVAFREPAKHSVMFWGRSPSKHASVVVEQNTGGTWRLVDVIRPNRHGIFAGTFSSTARSGFLRARLANGKDAALPFSLVVPPDRPGCPWGTC